MKPLTLTKTVSTCKFTKNLEVYAFLFTCTQYALRVHMHSTTFIQMTSKIKKCIRQSVNLSGADALVKRKCNKVIYPNLN